MNQQARKLTFYLWLLVVLATVLYLLLIALPVLPLAPSSSTSTIRPSIRVAPSLWNTLGCATPKYVQICTTVGFSVANLPLRMRLSRLW